MLWLFLGDMKLPGDAEGDLKSPSVLFTGNDISMKVLCSGCWFSVNKLFGCSASKSRAERQCFQIEFSFSSECLLQMSHSFKGSKSEF